MQWFKWISVGGETLHLVQIWDFPLQLYFNCTVQIWQITRQQEVAQPTVQEND